MSNIGAFTFVLHSHLPYVRLAGRWPHGEEWLHEALCETYIPLLITLYDLIDDGVKFKLVIGLTPVLIEQLSDPIVLHHFEKYVDDRIASAKRDMRYFDGHHVDVGPLMTDSTPAISSELRALAESYLISFNHIKTAFNERFGRDLLATFRNLQDQGYIEIMGSVATHAYLPLISRDSSIVAQFKTAFATYERVFGRIPQTFWLPECGYRPSNSEGDTLRPGLEYFLREAGVRVFFSETFAPTDETSELFPEENVPGSYGETRRNYFVPGASSVPDEHGMTTFQPYFVSNTLSSQTLAHKHSGVAVIARNVQTGYQVWSHDYGYPGDYDYREFHRKADTSGFQYWRITGENVALGAKDVYNPQEAKVKVRQHAEHFVNLVRDQLLTYHNNQQQYGLIASIYDTELFGHWWYEGIEWLQQVLRLLSVDENIELVTASQFVLEHPPVDIVTIPESSWGVGGTHFTWHNSENAWILPMLSEVELQMENLAESYDHPTDDETHVLNQMARELLLAQSSDWPFLITTGQATDYASQRFRQHIERFLELMHDLEHNDLNREKAQKYYEMDNVFEEIDFRWFRRFHVS